MEASSFFMTAHVHGTVLQGHYQWGLVVLSILVSIFSTTMALHTAQIARRTIGTPFQHIALLTGAFALGGGIWTMHFIGMLAYELPVRVDYNTSLTLASFLPAFLSSWLALHILATPVINATRLISSGCLTGAGIGLMHYTGMAAMETTAHHMYDPTLFGLSLVVAMLLSTLALWIRFGMHRTALKPAPRFLLSGVIMGLAIAGMHYVGMAGIYFIGEPQAHEKGIVLNSTFVSVALSSVTVTVTLMVAALNSLLLTRELYTRIEGSKSRLAATLNTAVDGIITIDSKGLIQSFNRSAERLFGWSADEVLGRNIKILMPDPDSSRHDSYLQNYHQSGAPKIIGTGREVMGLRKDGSLMPMRLAVGRMDLPDELLFVGFVSDISERHALEASLRETAERAEQAAAAKSTFLANMSHEIRTPMNSIIGFTELLLQSRLDDSQRKQLGNIRASSRSLLGLINDILDTTKMEKGHMQLENDDFSLEGLALQIESSLWPSAQGRKLSLKTHYPMHMPKYFKGDSLRILQVLTNLVGNAIKFTEQGGVEVSYAYDAGMVHIQVSDTGIGMTPEQVDSVFAPFTQADASISRRFGGTGLGTTISRQLVELMSGRIEVQSKLGEGSIFHVWLPLPLGNTPSQQLKRTQLASLPPLKFLIADDIAQNLELLSLTLEGQGHQVQTAHDGQSAFEQFVAQRFDVILLDMHMPRVDGLQATRMIRQYEQQNSLAPIPIIALTASVMDDDRRAARLAGMNGFSVKPLDVPHLFNEVARVLSQPDSDMLELDDEPMPSSASAPIINDIDWDLGVSRWGSQERLRTAIEQFLDKQPTQYPLDPSLAADRLKFHLHSIRGAAANLAMPRAAKAAADLESLLQSRPDRLSVTQLDNLQKILQQAAEQLAKLSPIRTSEPPYQGEISSTEALNALHALHAVVAANTLDDAVFERVRDALTALGQHVQADRLQQLIDNFEFESAKTLLETLIQTLSGTSATH